MLKRLHEGHVGKEKAKSRARQIFYWPGMNDDIEHHTKKCKVCEANSNKQQKETLMQYPMPERPWERLGIDIFTYAGRSYLVVSDSFSNWLELRDIKDKSIKSVIKSLKNIYSVFGSPDFRVCEGMEFQNTYQSPYYPRSNGLAKKGVGIGNNIVKKSLESGGDIEVALLQYRNSPLKFVGYSPSQLLMSKICKTKIPICAELLKPRLCENIKEKFLIKRQTYTDQYNKNSRDLRPLYRGSDVTVYNHVQKKWEPSQIVEISDSPRSYIVTDQFGNCVRRNRVDLRKSLNTFVPTKESTSSGHVEDPLSSKTDCNTNDQPYISQKPEFVDITPSFDGSIQNKINPKPVLETHKTSRSGRRIKPPCRLNL
ncbi:uncharacterized protein [Leptinotarsa decemlineata]|uniref:uncharacterized protein n=1 Tax=Leptinotarsa decemlineata TaxID=7539 RepID=UPI003D307853